MKYIKLFTKGIIVGIGGSAPGLSGAIIMIGLGLYSKTIDYIASLNKKFKKKMFFLMPIISGMLLSTVLFSRVIENLLDQFEVQTRLAFFGMLIGTVPLFFAEVRGKGKLQTKHYALMMSSFLVGLGFLLFSDTMSTSEAISVPIAFVLGFFGIVLTIIPGLNWASFFSAFGLYGHWLALVSFRSENFSLVIYISALIGALIGLFATSKVISSLLRYNYTATFSVLFGFFIAIIPSIILDSSDDMDNFSFGVPFYIGLVLFVIGIFVAYWLGKLSKASTIKEKRKQY